MTFIGINPAAVVLMIVVFTIIIVTAIRKK